MESEVLGIKIALFTGVAAPFHSRIKIPLGVKLSIVAVALVMGALGIEVLRDFPLRFFTGLEGFSARSEFALFDSLPALSPGLGELEAFKLVADPSTKTNADRSIWLSDLLDTVSMEYYSGKTRFDSAQFFLWTSDSVIRVRTLKRTRELRWKIAVRKKIVDWTEVVGVYIARPRFLKFRSTDSSVSVFEQIEGKVFHVVRRSYRDHKESPRAPDTSYPASAGEGPYLLAKGDALAIINPTAQVIEWRVIRLSRKRWDICRVEGKTVNIYRTLLKSRSGPVLAYSSPGRAHSLILKRREDPPLFFWLAP